MLQRRCLFALLALVLCLSLGCGRANRPIPVAGVVSVNGKGLADTRVTFNPVDSNGRMAFGMTDGEGRFKLTTFNHEDGALAGQYKITVSITGPATAVDPQKMANVKEMAAERERLLKLSQKMPQVHANYLNLAKTPLVQDVPVQGELKLELRKDGT